MINDPTRRPDATARTRVELFLPGGHKFTLTLRGRGFELSKAACATR
ncbi:hypothetical protein BH11ACT7_BH11ACT7_04740 [soil metagenome]